MASQATIGGERAATSGQPQSRERTEDDIGKRGQTVQDQREGADMENLLRELAKNVILTAHRPKQAS